MKPFYVTTPIYYINAAPHIGHAYTTIAADVLARALRLSGRPVHFLTGTDEHGLKIEKAAAEAKLSPKEYADGVSSKFRALWTALDVRPDDFIRTTEPRHEETVRRAFAAMLRSGDIYKGRYSGFYCVSDETYWTEKETLAGPGGAKLCPNTDCQRPLERVEEESYFFKLSQYGPRLLKHYDAHPEFLSPASRASEMRNFVKAGLQDISVSRAKVKWGVPVPEDESHTVYVWFDALLNYLAAADSKNAALWPADVHIVGKEIYRFHAVVWPAMLMALGRELPGKVFAHGWWTVEGEKMSKSKGNFVDPLSVTKEFGVDAFRFFLFREMPFGQDGDFSIASLKRRYNADLANDLGNLLNRASDMGTRYLDGKIPEKLPGTPLIERETHVAAGAAAIAAIEKLDFGMALTVLWASVGRLNQWLNEKAPWKLAKTDPAGAAAVISELLWSLRAVGCWIAPFMPETSARIHERIGAARSKWPISPEDALPVAAGSIKKGEPLFPRKI